MGRAVGQPPVPRAGVRGAGPGGRGSGTVRCSSGGLGPAATVLLPQVRLLPAGHSPRGHGQLGECWEGATGRPGAPGAAAAAPWPLRPYPLPRLSALSAPGRSCWRPSGTARCGSARPTPTRTAKVRMRRGLRPADPCLGGQGLPAGTGVPARPPAAAPARSGRALPGVCGASAAAAGPGPAGQWWVAPSACSRRPPPAPVGSPALCSPPDTLYFFGDNNFTEWGPLLQQYVPPPFRIPGTSPAYSFGIAGGCWRSGGSPVEGRGMDGAGGDGAVSPAPCSNLPRRLWLRCSLPLARPRLL